MEAPPVINAARPRSFWWLPVLLAVSAVGVVLFLFNPAQTSFYPRCTLYTTTGLYCPGCGSLRALHQMAHGHVLTALHYNPLLVLSLPFVAYYSLLGASRWAAGRPLPSLPLSAGWMIFFGVVLIVFAVLRNIHYAPFTWLAPP